MGNGHKKGRRDGKGLRGLNPSLDILYTSIVPTYVSSLVTSHQTVYEYADDRQTTNLKKKS